MIKPILFNTDMVRAILDNHKTVTRRVVKPQLKTECSHGGQHEFIRDDFIDGSSFTGFVCKKCGYGVCGPHFKFPIGTSWIRPPYRPGDILYVRETWCENGDYDLYPFETERFWYKADSPDRVLPTPEWFRGWRPSIHMPRKAARIFLRLTDIRVERLQAITENQAKAEGAREVPWAFEVDDVDGKIKNGPMQTAIQNFAGIWDSTIKLADRALYGWDANPYVWVIEFERISREEAQIDGRR